MNFQLRFIPPLTVSFDAFNPIIGMDGYRKAIRQHLLPQSNPYAFSLGAIPLESRTYCKGSVFSRVRKIRSGRTHTFMNRSIDANAFFPPPQSASIGRFNEQGERKLYLADHPYVALKECGIEPGDFFLFSYFSLKTDTHFVYADPNGGHFSTLLSELFKSDDQAFYALINDTFKTYLEFASHHGIAYDSVKVKEAFFDDTWGEIDSITNLAMAEDKMPAANLLAGWLAQCDENYRPSYMKMFIPLAEGRKRLSGVTYRGNEYAFNLRYKQVMEHIRQLERENRMRIQLNQYEDVDLSPCKWLPHAGSWLDPHHPGHISPITATAPLPPTQA
ncbi:hypothetical protein ACIQSO_05045 [Pseudomonas putida]|uniref:hypothetical protein n=1 Tax=Pseudomonas putida TaxID=303 RepID=UPI00383A90D5